MKPRDTKYCVAVTPEHYEQVLDFMESEGYAPSEELSHPTVTAVRDGTIVAMISTCFKDGYIVATDLILAKSLKRPFITFIRLWEFYEQLLRAAGVTMYLFELVGKETEFQDYARRLGYPSYHVTDQSTWYQRFL